MKNNMSIHHHKILYGLLFFLLPLFACDDDSVPNFDLEDGVDIIEAAPEDATMTDEYLEFREKLTVKEKVFYDNLRVGTFLRNVSTAVGQLVAKGFKATDSLRMQATYKLEVITGSVEEDGGGITLFVFTANGSKKITKKVRTVFSQTIRPSDVELGNSGVNISNDETILAGQLLTSISHAWKDRFIRDDGLGISTDPNADSIIYEASFEVIQDAKMGIKIKLNELAQFNTQMNKQQSQSHKITITLRPVKVSTLSPATDPVTGG